MLSSVNPYLYSAAASMQSTATGICRTKKSPKEKEKIMHISLPLTEHVCLMGADASELFGQKTVFGDNVCLTVCPPSEEETRRIYEALSKGGKIAMPLEKTFWAELYTMFTDKFGILWALNFTGGDK